MRRHSTPHPVENLLVKITEPVRNPQGSPECMSHRQPHRSKVAVMVREAEQAGNRRDLNASADALSPTRAGSSWRPSQHDGFVRPKTFRTAVTGGSHPGQGDFLFVHTNPSMFMVITPLAAVGQRNRRVLSPVLEKKGILGNPRMPPRRCDHPTVGEGPISRAGHRRDEFRQRVERGVEEPPARHTCSTANTRSTQGLQGVR